MKILFVTDLCPIFDDEKGLPNTLLNFILDFKKLGADVTLFRPNVIPNIYLRRRKIYAGGIYYFKGIKCINKNYWIPFFKEKDFNFLKNNGYDAIIGHMPSGVLAGCKVAKLTHTPFFAGVHASDIRVLVDFKYSFLREEMKEAYLRAKNVACRSYWLKDKIEEIIPKIKDRAYVIPSGIDEGLTADFGKIEEKAKKFFHPPLKIFAAGSLIKRKGFDILIEAVSKMQDVRLKIAGDGPYEKKLKKLVKKLNAASRVRFLGKISRNDVFKIMDESSVFALPSVNETFGMVYLEAMARGCITLCLENSGMAGFIKDGFNGFLIEHNANSVADTLNRIRGLENPYKIMSNALKTSYDMERTQMARNYLSLIQNILF